MNLDPLFVLSPTAKYTMIKNYDFKMNLWLTDNRVESSIDEEKRNFTQNFGDIVDCGTVPMDKS